MLEETIRHFLNEGFDIVSLDTMHQVLTGSRKARKFVVFTFDDGFRDHYTLVYPIFKRHQVPFTIYLATGIPDHTYLFWPYLLNDLILSRRDLQFSFEGRDCACPLDSDVEKTSAYSNLRAQILGLPKDQLRPVLSSLFAPHGVDLDAYSRDLALTWEQVIELSQDDLVTIGAHTVNHLDLSRMGSQEVAFEVGESQRAIETRTRKLCEHFAYPFGCKPRVENGGMAALHACGFKTCTTTLPGYLCAEHRDFLDRLPRYNMDEDTPVGTLDISFKSAMDLLSFRRRHFVTG